MLRSRFRTAGALLAAGLICTVSAGGIPAAASTVIAAGAPAPAPSSSGSPGPALSAGVPVAPVPPGTTPGDRPPPGALDGVPMTDAVPPKNEQIDTAAVAAVDTTRRYFGDGPWNAIKSAAASKTMCSGLTPTELQAMVLTTIFRESSGATAAGGEPAPMTLSRYDEWTGVKSGATNADANYGLYAFRDPNTIYKRAFWHPGIGIWQYDSAGLGAPFTAAQRINTAFLAGDVAQGMRDRYCTSTQTTEAGKRYDAWYPWYLSCDTSPEQVGSQINPNAVYCEQIYQGLMQTNFGNVTLTPGFSAAGGMVQRTCRLRGYSENLTCWLIDPAKAQGANWWATATPLDGGAPNRSTSPITPISTPFYDFSHDGVEQRYWLKVDSGYNADFTGTRVLGKNARPKDNQPGSGISWSPGPGLCDVTAHRGACDPAVPPAGVRSTALSITDSGYSVIPFDFNGDRIGDVYLYAAGPTPERLLIGRGNGVFSSYTIGQAQMSYVVKTADVNGDARDDLILVQPSAGVMYVQLSRGDGTFSQQKYAVPVGAQVYPFDWNGDRRSDLLVYTPGAGADVILTSTASGALQRQATTINGYYQVRTGDFDGNGLQDVLFYAQGSTTGFIWRSSAAGPNRTTTAIRAVASSAVEVGDLDGDRLTDIVWRATGRATVWWGDPQFAFSSATEQVAGNGRPVIVDLPADGRQDVMWWTPGAGADSWTRWAADRVATTSAAGISATQTPSVGRFSTGGNDGIIWYGNGTVSDWVWWR